MIHINKNATNLDLKSLRILDKIEKLIKDGSRKGFIPILWKQKTLQDFSNIKKALLEKHDEEYSRRIYKDIVDMVKNLDKAINKSKV